MGLKHKCLIPAHSGNTLIEYGIVAMLILLVALPGFYLAGNHVRQWIHGLKIEMSHHRDTATSISQRVQQEAAKASQQPTNYNKYQLGTDDDHSDAPPNRIEVSGANGERINIIHSPQKPKQKKQRPLRNQGKASKPAQPAETPEEQEEPEKLEWCKKVESGTCKKGFVKSSGTSKWYSVIDKQANESNKEAADRARAQWEAERAAKKAAKKEAKKAAKAKADQNTANP